MFAEILSPKTARVALYVYILIVPLIVALLHSNSSAIIVASAGIAALLITHLEDLESLSFFSVSAKMRTAIREAEATVEQLRALAVPLAESNFATLMMSGNLMASLTYRSKFALHDQIIDSLVAIGCSKSQIDRAQAGWIEAVGQLVFNTVVERLMKIEVPGKNVVDEFALFRPTIGIGPLSKSDLQRFWDSINGPTSDFDALIAEYDGFLETGRFKNAELIPLGAQIAGKKQTVPR